MDQHSAPDDGRDPTPGVDPPGLPLLLVAHDRGAARESVAAELARRYSRDYEIRAVASAEDAVGVATQVDAGGGAVALLLAQAAGEDGTDAFAGVRALFPDVRRGLLVEWGDWADPEASRAVLELMAAGRIDYYVIRPWRSPDEHFHRTVTEFLLEWERATGVRPRELTIVGRDRSVRAHELRSLLARSGVPHAWVDADSARGRGLRAGLDDGPATDGDDDAPSVLLHDGRVLHDPSNAELTRAYGVTTELPREADVDLAVVGAGPAGLSAAVYGASEGLRTWVLECDSVGGQASSSSLIRNYLGFARGLSGADLAARAYQQAWVFGAHFALTREVVSLGADDDRLALVVDPAGEPLRAGAVVLATGVAYRRLGVPDLEALVGAGVFYGASAFEARGLAGRTVHVVGGGNSAGQAALHLARYAARVELLVRGDSLAESMSSYLVQQLAAAGVVVRHAVEVLGGGGDGVLDHVVLRSRHDGSVDQVATDALVVLIGAAPRTSWLPPEVLRDAWGYVLTGQDVVTEGGRRAWPLTRPPAPLETSMPGVFAVGDVRSRSVKRVASAVGEGSVVVSQVHAHISAAAASRGAGR